MPFTVAYLLIALVLTLIAGFLGYRMGGVKLALITVSCAFAFLLVTLVGLIALITNQM